MAKNASKTNKAAKGDDLTRIAGIGPATAAALTGAGITTYLALAALTPPLDPEIDKLGSPDEWANWIAEARTLAVPTGGVSLPVLVVRTREAKGRWRAGRHFTREPVEINANELSVEEIAAIEGDPMLISSREERPPSA